MASSGGVCLEISPHGVAEGDPSVLMAVAFGAPRSAVCGTSPRVEIPLPYLTGTPSIEIWRSDNPVVHATRGDFVVSTSGDVLFGASVVNEAPALQRTASSLYQSAVSVAKGEGFPHIVRMWNHFPAINQPENGLERYQAFCAGRAEGFERAGYASTSDLPAASGVGTDGEGLLVMFLASNKPVRYVENPRQVSAFRYPRKFGPRSPSFARASVCELAGERQLFVSGTASIVGCETVHVGNLRKQFDETVENLRAVCEAASDGEISELSQLSGAIYRVYVRHPEHFEPLREMFDRVVDANAESVWVRGDICRSDLLLEIELWTRM